MPLELHTFMDAGSFLERVHKSLEKREAFNNLILGTAIRLKENPEWVIRSPYLATVETLFGEILLSAVITPPKALLLAGEEDAPQEAFEALVTSLQNFLPNPPGVLAPHNLGERFAITWAQENRLHYRVEMRQRVYELRKVMPIQFSTGSLRLAAHDDLETAIRWRNAFYKEAMEQTSPADDSLVMMTRQIAKQNVFFWDDHGPVSMAIRSRPTPHGITVSGVFTPPEQRRKGYATTCVAALSQQLLSQGKDFCTLFTDLKNPTSNDIYLKIGYVPVGDFTVFQFVTLRGEQDEVTGGII